MLIPFLKKSLTARLVFSFFLLSLLSVGLSGLIASLQARRALQDSMLERLGVVASLKEDALKRWVQDQIESLRLFADMELTQRMKNLQGRDVSEVRTVLSPLLKAVAMRKPEWQELFVLSSRGQVLVSTDEAHEDEYLLLDTYFIEGQKGVFVQKVYPSPLTLKPTISIAMPLTSAANGPVLALHLNLEGMEQIILAYTGLGRESEAYLVGTYNEFISGERFGTDEFPRGIHSPGIEAALQGRNGTARYENYRGVPVLGAYRWIRELGVALITEVPQDLAFAPARRLVSLLLLSGLGLTLILAAAVYLLARQIARPILDIAATARTLADGDLQARTHVQAQDETGALAGAFNTMAARLAALYADLRLEIAERKAAEEKRNQVLLELEEKNAELEKFTYTVSHDLKSPLVTIKGYLGFLQKDIEAGNRERVERDLAYIGNAADTMNVLLQELLELSRVGRLVNPSEAVALSVLVDEAVKLVSGQIHERGITVSVEPGMPVVQGDRVRLLEVFQNLIDNAAKFMGDQAAPCIKVGAAVRDGDVLCYVRDNGIGIESPYLEKIFGLFERLETGTEGTGVGLTLVRRIVEVHGGHIWAVSEGTGTGCTMYFTLPLTRAGGPPLTPVESSP